MRFVPVKNGSLRYWRQGTAYPFCKRSVVASANLSISLMVVWNFTVTESLFIMERIMREKEGHNMKRVLAIYVDFFVSLIGGGCDDVRFVSYSTK